MPLVIVSTVVIIVLHLFDRFLCTKLCIRICYD
jgi:hypothetical protein